MMKFLATLLLFLTLMTPVFAVQPDEMLDDPVLEARAREISKKLRCPICQGENIDESNAAISRDLRLYVRERLVAGDSNGETIDAVVDRYGEFVLFEPPTRGINLILWLAGPFMAMIGGLIVWRFMRGREAAPVADPLTDDEQERLKEIMQE